MRIISKFQDYYDGLMDPSDKEFTFVRHTEFLPFDNPYATLFDGLLHGVSFSNFRPIDGEPICPEPTKDQLRTAHPNYFHKAEYSRNHPYRHFRGHDDHTYARVKVVFCGKLYVGVRYKEWWGDHYKPDPIYYWTPEAFAAAHEFRKDSSKALKDSAWVTWDPDEKVAKTVEDIFHIPAEAQKIVLDASLELKTAIMTQAWNENETHEKTIRGVVNCRGAYRTQLNPKLKDVQFYKRFDAAQTFQELTMFLGGVIAHVDTPEPQSNRGKIEGHGFDYKESFRKGPTKEHR